jgi:CAAX protease family protein
VTTATERAGAAQEGLFARYPLVFFFLLSFIFTWGYFWLILAPLSLPSFLIGLGGFGPAASAFLVLALTSGKPGVLGLLRSIVHWRVGVQWYLVALLGVPVLNLVAYLVIPGALAEFAPNSSLPLLYLSEIVFSLTLGVAPLWEEIGWRGFAQPRIQRLHAPVLGSLILGASGACGTFPSFMDPWRKPDPVLPSSALALL